MRQHQGLRARGFRDGAVALASPPSFFTRARKQVALALLGLVAVVGGAIATTSSAFVKDRLAPAVVLVDRWICKATTYIEPINSAGPFHVVVARLAGDPGDVVRDRLKFAIHERTALPVSDTCQRVNLSTDGTMLSVLSAGHDDAQKLLEQYGGDMLLWGYVGEPGVATLHLSGRGINWADRRYRVSLSKLEDFLRDVLLVEVFKEVARKSHKEEERLTEHQFSKISSLEGLKYDETWKPAVKEAESKLPRRKAEFFFARWQITGDLSDLESSLYYQESVFRVLDEDPIKPKRGYDRQQLKSLYRLYAEKSGSERALEQFMAMASRDANELNETEQKGAALLQSAKAWDLQWRVLRKSEDRWIAIAFACNALGISLNEPESPIFSINLRGPANPTDQALELLEALGYSSKHIRSRQDCPE